MTEPKQSFTEEAGKPKEYWLEKIEHETGTELAVWDFRPPFEAEFASCEKDFIHVIEHSALVAERARNAELEIELSGWCKDAKSYGDEIAALKAELSEYKEMHGQVQKIAIERHDQILSLESELATTKRKLALFEKVASTAQGILTCLNIGNVMSESPLHLDLRKTMIEHRAKLAELDRELEEAGK